MDAQVRVRLAQEFFFHLIGTVEMVAKMINDKNGWLAPDDVGIRKVCDLVPQGSALCVALGGLCQRVRGAPVPADPYGEEGLLFRAFVYRHSVTHSHFSPFVFRVGSAPTTSLLIDPRRLLKPGMKPETNHSARSAEQELWKMLEVVRHRCTETLSAL